MASGQMSKRKGAKTPPKPKPRPSKNMVPKGGKVDMPKITGGKTVGTAGVDKLKAGAVSKAAAKKSSGGASPKTRSGTGKAFLSPKPYKQVGMMTDDDTAGR